MMTTPADVDLGHDRPDERHQVLAAWMPGAAHHKQVLAVVQHVGDLADRVAGGGAHGQADQLVIAELLRVRGLRQLAGVDAEPAAGQFPGRGPVRDPGEQHEQLA